VLDNNVNVKPASLEQRIPKMVTAAYKGVLKEMDLTTPNKWGSVTWDYSKLV
jgi:hypothetical protein